MAWCFVDEASGDADDVLGRLERETALAPAHWPLEVANALRTAERRGRLDATDLPRLRALLAALPVEIAPVELTTAVGGPSPTSPRRPRSTGACVPTSKIAKWSAKTMTS